MSGIRVLLLVPALIVCHASAISLLGQVSEPEFIGEAFVLKADQSTMILEKEFGDFSEGISWSSNSWKALSLEVSGSKARIRFGAKEPLQLVVRAVDNDSDPLTIVSIYKLKSKKKSRTVLISKDNSGTVMKSKTNSKALIRFTGKKFGKSSYLITLSDLAPGEYGIIVTNPNARDEKRTVVSCFGID